MINYTPTRGFLGGANGKEPAHHCRRHKRHRFNPWVRKEGMEVGMATYSSILVWKIPYWSRLPLLVCSDFLFLHHSMLIGCIRLWIYPFILGYLICWCMCVHARSLQSCLTLSDPMNCSPPIPRSGRFPWSMKWQLTPVFLPGKCHGQRSLVGYSPRGYREWDPAEWLSTHKHTLKIRKLKAISLMDIDAKICNKILAD